MDSSDNVKDHVETWKFVLKVNEVFLKDHLRKRDVVRISDYLFKEGCIDVSFLSKIQNATTSGMTVLALYDHVRQGDLNCVTAYCTALKKTGRLDVLRRLEESYDENHPFVDSGAYDTHSPTSFTAFLWKALLVTIGATYVYARFCRSKLYEHPLSQYDCGHSHSLNQVACQDHVDTWKLALRVNRVFLMDHLGKRDVICIADYLFQAGCIEADFSSTIERTTASPKAVIELMDLVHQGDRHCVVTYCTALKKIGRDDVLQRLQESYSEFYPVLDPGAYDRRPPTLSTVLFLGLLSTARAAVNAYVRFLVLVRTYLILVAAAMLKLCPLLVCCRASHSPEELHLPDHCVANHG